MATQPTTPSRCVLVVDDDPRARYALASLLRAGGFPADTAADGREALCYLRNHAEPLAVLLDLRMPVMDGWRFCEEVRSDPRLAAVPVVVCSGYAGLHGEAAVLNVRAAFPKPIDADALLGTLRGLR